LDVSLRENYGNCGFFDDRGTDEAEDMDEIGGRAGERSDCTTGFSGKGGTEGDLEGRKGGFVKEGGGHEIIDRKVVSEQDG
jgi:hypothetical protein